MPRSTPDTPSTAVVKGRVPPPLLAALDRAAEVSGQTRSACLRELLSMSLAARGLWPPAPDGGSDASL